MYELLKLLEKNARLSLEELAAMLGRTEAQVAQAMDDYEKAGILRGYTSVVDWEKTERDIVTARIEVQVTPKKDRGFDELAETISQYKEVQSLYLMSGGYDLALTLVGRSFKEIASFVAYRLAPLDGVQSTATHFVLRKYKEKNIILLDTPKDERGVML
ncbi:Lrp/AsnC family transcriptional regulator [Oscillospiraceae bacterium MB08-C2-2]|nr:Lrp/AsnC family transcriptional regulator [Oscillospiraceae bacterium MB08-C2-2]